MRKTAALWLATVLTLLAVFVQALAMKCSPAEKSKIQHELRRFVERGSTGYFMRVDPKRITEADRQRLGPCRLPFVGLTATAGLQSSDCLTNSRGATMFHLAISEGKSRAVEALEETIRKHGAEGIDRRNTAGLTPLMLAAKLGNDALVALLLKGKAQVGLVCEQRGTPFTALSFAAAESNLSAHVCHQGRVARYSEVVKLLLAAGASLAPPPGVKGQPPLLLVATSGSNAAVAQELLTAGADPDVRGERGMTPLHYAAEHGDAELVNTLIEHRAAVNVVAADGVTPLQLAAKLQHAHSVDVIQALVRGGAKLELRAGKMAMTALIFAIIAGGTETVAQLLQSGSNARAATSDGVTALMWASQAGSASVVADLLKHGADANVKTPAGATALDIALHGEHTDSARLLRAASNLSGVSAVATGMHTSVIAQGGAAACALFLCAMMKLVRGRRTTKAGDLQL